MARRRFGRPLVKRRGTQWIAGTADFNALGGITSGSQTLINTSSVSEGSIPNPGTIIRMRGCIHIEIALEAVASCLQEVGLGIGLMDDKAVAAGAVALPLPINDEDWEGWMWWHCTYLGFADTSSGAVGDRGDHRIGARDIIIDSKAMRKWDENQTLVFMGQNRAIDGTASTVEVAAHTRILIKDR